MAISIGAGVDYTKTSGGTQTSGTQTTQKFLTQSAVDKIIADVLGGEQGLASLASGENVSGLSGTSVRTQLAQDLVTKLVGEIANVTAETRTVFDQEQQNQQSTKKGSAGLKTVICTELLEQGRLDEDLYWKAHLHSLAIDPVVHHGYMMWAPRVVQKMKQSSKLSAFLAPIVSARYEHVTGQRKNLLGGLTVWIGHPICWVIGKVFQQPILGAYDGNTNA
jgi:hypothetical protein